AIELTKELDGQATLENYLAAVQYLKTHPGSTGKVGVIGFCWGGRMANLVAVNAPDLSAAVPFYGQQPALEDVPKIKASLLLHYAGQDEKINAGIPAYEAALKEAGIAYQIYMYEDAKHAFHNDAKADRYHKEAAQLAWKRTVEFLNKKLK
ncbi:MAG: dienelactone hydrolase family protein, partial [Deltaproteobacteria bacterium]|nr:dienelactone hydrolase family protein [Deltaproteobacteria bacterium]